MPIILAAARLFAGVNAPILAIGRGIAIVLMALMVVVILIQIYFRFIDGTGVEALVRSLTGIELSNGALPWTEEAARFMMLWVVGVAVPTAFRRGGFVAIDMVLLMLPRTLGGLVSLALLGLSLLVLVVGVKIGWGEVTGFGGRFATAALKYPTDLSFENWVKVPRSWMMASLLVGLTLMVSVCVELIIRTIAELAGRGADLPEIPESATVGAE
ncbi:MAG: TRAP transporter small permease subunit [Litoreibacter sp.]|nr:TRAP transporter small permease subunit [Litoreibacter sp.]MCY4336130.1 TRAP transporter small permease subunit [Litoreibacter sp.]